MSSEDSKSNPLTKEQKKLLAAYFYMNFCVGASSSILAPFFPREAELKGASPSQYGLIFSIQEIICFFLCPVFVKLLPVINNRWMVFGGAIVASLSITCFGLLKWSPAGKCFIILAFIIRSISAIGSSALITGNYSSIPVLFGDHMAQAYGTFELGQGLGSIFGPFIGGLVYQYTDFSGPFFVMATLELIAAVVIFIFIPPSPKCENRSTGNSFKSVLSNYWISMNLFVSIVACIFLGFNDSSLEPHIRSIADLSPFQTGSIFLSSGLTYAISSQLFGWVIDKMKDPTYLSAFSLFLCSFSVGLLGPLYGLPFTAKLWTIVLSQILLHVGLAIAFVGTFDGAMKAHGRSDLCDDPLIPRTISSIFVAFYCFGNGVGPALAGFLVENMGYRKAGWPLVCLGIITGIVLWVSGFNAKQKRLNWFGPSKEDKSFYRRVSISKSTHIKCVATAMESIPEK